MSAHQHFTVSTTAYLSTLDTEELHTPCVAVHHQRAPRDLGNGTSSIGLRFPILLVTNLIDGPEDFAAKVAQILEKHWDDEPDATTQSYDSELLAALEIAVSVLDAADLVWLGSDRAKSAIVKARGRSPQPASSCAAPAEVS